MGHYATILESTELLGCWNSFFFFFLNWGLSSMFPPTTSLDLSLASWIPSVSFGLPGDSLGSPDSAPYHALSAPQSSRQS